MTYLSSSYQSLDITLEMMMVMDNYEPKQSKSQLPVHARRTRVGRSDALLRLPYPNLFHDKLQGCSRQKWVVTLIGTGQRIGCYYYDC